jgi:hypothetical protein
MAENTTVAFNNILNNLLGDLGQEWEEKRLSFASISSVQTQPIQDSLVQDAVHGTVRVTETKGDSLSQIQLNRDLLSPAKKRNIYDRVRNTSESHTSEPSTRSSAQDTTERILKLQDLFVPPSQETLGRVVYPGGKRKTRISTADPSDDERVTQSLRSIVQGTEDNTQAFQGLLSRLDALETQFSPARPHMDTPFAKVTSQQVDPSPARPFARDSISSRLPTTVNTPEDRPSRKPVLETSHYSFDVPIYQVDTLSKPPVKPESLSNQSFVPMRLHELREEETPKPNDTPVKGARVAVKTAASVKNLEQALDSLANLSKFKVCC